MTAEERLKAASTHADVTAYRLHNIKERKFIVTLEEIERARKAAANTVYHLETILRGDAQ